MESENVKNKKRAIKPKDNHISLREQGLHGMGIDYMSAAVTECEIQVFFHDPDGYMVEICNCENLPVLPITSCPLKPPKPWGSDMQCTTQVSAMMMENLLIDMFDISI